MMPDPTDTAPRPQPTDPPALAAARSFEAIEHASQLLFDMLSEKSEDALEDAYADTWPGGPEDWFENGWRDSGAEAHRERVFRLVLEDLARRCTERATANAT